jgi:hypothetical protein
MACVGDEGKSAEFGCVCGGRAAHSRIMHRATPPIAAAYNPSSCTQNLTQKTIKIIIVPRPRRKKQRAEKICMKFPSVGGGAATLAFCVLFALVCVC